MSARVLIIGGGARSHALAHVLLRSPSVAQVVFAPGTSGLEAEGFDTVPVASQDIPGLLEIAALEAFDLTIVGPNTPLVDGIVDRFEAEGLPIFGPTKAAARLEGSKVFARLLMSRLHMPTPRFAICDTAERAAHLAQTQRWARVFKVDGIAYDQGVRVTHALSEVDDALEAVLIDNIHSQASGRIVVEERIDGDEITVFTLTNGHDLVVLGHVWNFPRLLEGDSGPPTRGMGQISPAPQLSEAALQRVVDTVLKPTLDDMAEAGRPIRGALFVDMLMRDGEPYILDFNVRFGDPATQTMLTALDGDFYQLMRACLPDAPSDALQSAAAAMIIDPRPRVSLVLVAEGYPTRRIRDALITIDRAAFEHPDIWLFLDGVRQGPDGELRTTGGRIVTVVAAGASVEEARERAYAASEAITFEGKRLRMDIGARPPAGMAAGSAR